MQRPQQLGRAARGHQLSQAAWGLWASEPADFPINRLISAEQNPTYRQNNRQNPASASLGLSFQSSRLNTWCLQKLRTYGINAIQWPGILQFRHKKKQLTCLGGSPDKYISIYIYVCKHIYIYMLYLKNIPEKYVKNISGEEVYLKNLLKIFQ